MPILLSCLRWRKRQDGPPLARPSKPPLNRAPRQVGFANIEGRVCQSMNLVRTTPNPGSDGTKLGSKLIPAVQESGFTLQPSRLCLTTNPVPLGPNPVRTRTNQGSRKTKPSSRKPKSVSPSSKSVRLMSSRVTHGLVDLTQPLLEGPRLVRRWSSLPMPRRLPWPRKSFSRRPSSFSAQP
jgi:hypothetical protein